MGSDEQDRRGTYPYLTEYISLKEVAELLSVDRTNARRLLKSAGVPAFRFGSSIRYRRSDVDDHLADCREA